MDPTLGQITCFAGSYVPKGFVACDGRLLRMSDYPALGQFLSNLFGGDGASNFGLPNLPPVATLPWVSPSGRTETSPAMNWIMASDGTAPNSGSLGIVSEVRPFAQAPDPGGPLAQSWLPCDGRIMNVASSVPLFNLLGSQFGGNGQSTFALPDLPPLVASNGAGREVPLKYYICVDGRYPQYDCDAVNPGSESRYFQEGMLASVVLFATVRAPHLCGFALLQGQELSTSVNEALWLLLGNLYGGVANKTYVLPNVKASDDGISYAIVWTGIFPPSP